MNQVPIEFSYEVIRDRFYAGEYPRDKNDRSAKAKVQKFLDFGITDFIDLTEDGEKATYTFLLPKGIGHYRFPILDRSVPEMMEQLQEILDTIDRLIVSDRKVYVHCWGGIDRTGLIVGCWFVYKGMSVEDALAEFERLWATNPKSAWTTPMIRYRKDFVVRYADWLHGKGK